MDIDEILEKHFTKHGLGLFKITYPKLYYANQQAIKEIVEATIDMCAEDAKVKLTADVDIDGYPTTFAIVDKESILQVKNKIKY